MADHEVDAMGFVVNAFFRGRRRVVAAVAELLGVGPARVAGVPATLRIGPGDRVTPGMLDAAMDLFWEAD